MDRVPHNRTPVVCRRLFADRGHGMGRISHEFSEAAHPFNVADLTAIAYAAVQVWVIRHRVKDLKLRRDGERCVGQFLERLRESEAQVFHDVPALGFNLDHVIISPHGLYPVETKTRRKPWPKATISVDGDTLRVAGQVPDCDRSRR